MFRFIIVPFCFTAGCEFAAPSPAVDPQDAMAKLQQETGYRWTVRYHRDAPTAAFLEGGTRPMAASIDDAQRAARQFITQHAYLFGFSSGDSVSVADSEIDPLGMIHTRFQHRKGSLPVWGGELVAHFSPDGGLVRINGRSLPLSRPGGAPVLTEGEARVHAIADARALRPDVAPTDFDTSQTKLWIYPISTTEARLAYRIETEIKSTVRPMRLQTFVDAQNGDILHHSDTLSTIEGSGVGVFGDRKLLQLAERNGSFWLEDPTRGDPPQKTYSAKNGGSLPGSQLHSKDRLTWDAEGPGRGSAVDAHANVAQSFDYFSRVHQRSGWDASGKGVRSTVHFGDHFANAFFDGSQLVFGDGDDESMEAPAAALDIVAHEFTHGIVANTARLDHEGEPGALNEAIADIFGCFVGYSGAHSDWQIGEAVYHRARGRAPIRDLAEPRATDNPSSMHDYVETSDDAGGVHINSTIVSHAAYLMTEGGGPFRIEGVGAPAAERIWYRALTRYLTQQSTFADAADATVASARELGENEDAVRKAWATVGVVENIK